MLYSKRINKILFFTLLLSSSIHQLGANATETPASQIEQIPADVAPQLQEHLDSLWTSLAKQAKELDSYCEDIALLIRNNVLKTKDKDKAVHGLSELRGLLFKIYERSSVAITIDDVIGTELVLKGLIEHISKVLDKKAFGSFRSFDVAGALRFVPTSDDFIFTIVDENINKLEKLHKQIGNAGIAWYNKAYRVFNKLILQPTIKYDLHKWGAAILIVGGAAWFARSRWIAYDNQVAAAVAHTLANAPHSAPASPTSLPAQTAVPETAPSEPTIASAPAETAITNPQATALQDQLTSYKLTQFFNEVWPAFQVCNITGITALAAGLLAAKGKTVAHTLSRGLQAIHFKMMGGIFAAKGAPKDALENALKEPRYTFNDVIGNEYTKELLSRIKFYLEDPERFDSAGIRIPKGYLFGGPSRCGKTFMAEALAGEIREHLRKIGKNPDSFKFLSVTNIEVNVLSIEVILARAKRMAPCLLFIDEIDLLGLQRTTNQTQLSEFLTAMSGCMENSLEKQVIIVAATNRPENIEEALCKPGRFGKYVQFTRPTYAEKKAFIKHKLEGFAIDTTHFDIDAIVRETSEEAVFAALDDIINTALLDAKQQGIPLKQHMLIKALDEELHHIVPADKCNFPLEEKKLIAAHFAGHALAMILLDTSHKLTKVTINPIADKPIEQPKGEQFYEGRLYKMYKEYGQVGKVFTFREGNGLHADSAEELIGQCKESLSGYAAENILRGSCSYGYPHYGDGEEAFEIAAQVTSKGLSMAAKQFPDAVRQSYVQEALKLKNECEQAIEELLAQHKALLQAIADNLLEKATLSRSDIDEIIRRVEPELAAKILPAQTNIADIIRHIEPDFAEKNLPEKIKIESQTESAAESLIDGAAAA